MTMESQGVWTCVLDTDRELHIHDRVIDGHSMPEVVDKSRGEYKLQYANGDTMWLDAGMVGWDELEGGWTVI